MTGAFDSAVQEESVPEELKRYVRFSSDDAARLAAVREQVAPAFSRIAVELYDRLREHEAAHAVFVSEEQIERLHRSLIAWLERLFGGTYDAAYFAQTERIGKVHARDDVPQRYVIAAMSVIRGSLGALIDDRETRAALDRLLDIELGVMLEVARRSAADRRLAEREESSLDIAAQVAPIMIVGLDKDGAVFSFNSVAEKTTGWSREEILGKSFFETVIPDEARASTVAAFAGGAVYETSLVTRRGRSRRTRWRFAQVDGVRPGGRVTFAFGADVTEELGARRNAEQRLRLDAAATMVAGLAHAIRNPLNGAGLHLALTERSLAKADRDEARETLRVATTELRRLGALVTEFLEFARPKPLVRSAVDIGALVERAIAKTAPLALERGAVIRADLPHRRLSIEADEGRLEQILVYLIENACEVVGPTGGAVLLRARREPKNISIEIEDNGPGLSDPQAPIFDAFYSTKPDGTGLGLAIVHRVVAEHGGEIEVDSHPGATRFRLRLPLSTDGVAP